MYWSPELETSKERLTEGALQFEYLKALNKQSAHSWQLSFQVSLA
jgi:hypothetical protein